MPKVVITGGAGFIGSNLAEAMVNSGWAVTAIDDLSFGSLNNLESIKKDSNFQFVKSDICQSGALDDACKDTQCLVHLAAYKIPRYGGALKTLNINNDGTRAALECASKYGLKFILASTSDVYGKNANPPFKEGDNLVLGPPFIRRWAYAVSKAFDEQLAMAYYDERELPIVILRFFGSYGPHNHRTWWGGPQAVFIEQALQNHSLSVHGDGRQTRSFCYVSDTVRGIKSAIETDRAIGEIINIGSINEISIEELARKVIVLADSKSEIEFIAYEQFGGRYEDVRNRVPDLAKAKRLLRFEPKISLDQGLTRTIEWHKRFARMSD
ncbi:MAG: NAD-dependent epimerase/dehydratase family protein [candidate division Zixibacteria bacterium]|nr:NAD-dependent epimerase/dehydratase family protein [candidate division Zixibacteria bacterium]